MNASCSTALSLPSLMECHGAELRRHLTGMLGREDDAEDVLQEVWITLHETPPDTGPGSNVRAWLFRVATNTALSRMSKDRRRRAALDGRRSEVIPEPEPPPDAGLDGLSESARLRVREHLNRLPTKQREAVRMRWVVGAAYPRIARRLNCSEASARANVYNGLKRLREQLFDLWSEEVRG